MKTLILSAAIAGLAFFTQDMQEPSPPSEQHRWLQQFVGEWDVTAEFSMGPDAPPMQMQSTEKVRSLGGLWILGELNSSMFGTPFTALLTLGYDPKRESFVGTWVDTMQPHMWSYTGSLDEAKKVLTLDTEGPSFTDPSATAEFREVIEWKDADHRVFSSSVKGEDGEWFTFMRADYRRKK